MIADIKAKYTGMKDLVEVAVLLFEDDGKTSLHRLIDTATVTLMHDKHDMETVELDSLAFNKEFDQFFVYFIHPPIQRNMSVRLDVSLLDDRSAGASNVVQMADLLSRPDQLQNPSLAGRELTDFTGERGFELL